MFFLPPSKKGFISLTDWPTIDEVSIAKEDDDAVGVNVGVVPKVMTGGIGNFTSFSNFELAKKLGRLPPNGAGSTAGATDDGAAFDPGVGIETEAKGGSSVVGRICCMCSISLLPAGEGCGDGLVDEVFEEGTKDLVIEKGKDDIGNMVGSSSFEASIGGA